MLWLPGEGEKPFSIAHDQPLSVLVAAVGPFTAALHWLRPGDWLWWRGPYGRGFSLPPRPTRGSALEVGLLLVAGGYGVAPLILLAEQARASGWPVTLLLGARTAADLLLQRDFESLECAVVPCTDDGSVGRRGLVTDAAREFVRKTADGVSCVYGCGPAAMLEALRRICGEYGLCCQLCYEALMKCGFGVCGSCAREGLLICRDGPVLECSGNGEPLRRTADATRR
jgi:dihydroorotate dehydrogenase electron transfer subunit